MNLLFIVPYVPSPIRVRPFNLIRQLSVRHDITLLATAATPTEHDDAARLAPYCRTVASVPFSRSAALRSCAAAAVRGEPLQAAVCWSPAVELRLRQLLASRPFDLVHVEHLRAARCHAHLPRDLPAVFDAVDCISLLHQRTIRAGATPRQRFLALLELQRTRRFEARVLPRFRRVVVSSPVDAAALRALAPSAQPTVIPNGVDFASFRPIPGAAEPDTLVLSGKMSYHANVTAALHFVRRIYPLVKRARPGVRLRIVGSAPPASIRALAADPSIAVSGHVPDLGLELSRATVAVCPVTVKVGVQNKILEAMASGTPVVSTSQGAEGLLAEPGRDFLVAGDPSAFAQQVCRLLEDPVLRHRVASAGRRYVETCHRWEHAAHDLELTYGSAGAASGFYPM